MHEQFAQISRDLFVSTLEAACRILNLRDQIGLPVKEYREHGDEYGRW